MSAITVIYNLDGRPVETGVMDRVLDRLEHRGNDSRGVWIDGNIGLGHRMRWTTPESLHEKLPLCDPESRLVVTCDARIDNRDDLFSQLSFSGRPKSEITDSDIILAAYDKWGEECPAKLIGDFIFAIWDPKAKSLFCARDPLGVKHFYYCYRPGKLFAIASEIKALLQIKEIPCVLNEERLGDYLVMNTGDKISTYYKDIYRLPATHSLVVGTGGSLRIRSYWQPDSKEIKLKSDGEYREAFRDLFTEAVTCRLRSAFPVGSLLSGGLDSSAVVCAASEFLRNQGRPPLETFSAVFPSVAKIDPRIDEMRYMQSVIESSGCVPHFVNADDQNPLQDMESIVWHADDPVGWLNVFMETQIYKHAQAQNVRVLLSGLDGDSTVSYGFEDFEGFIRRGRFFRLAKEALAIRRNLPSRQTTLKGSLWHYGFKQVIPARAFATWRKIMRQKPPTRRLRHPLNHASVTADFRAKHDLEGRIRKFRKLDEAGSTPAEQHWQALTSGMYANMLEQLEKISSPYQIEPRHPFFDRRLIEFCIALPPGQRLSQGWTRSIFRFSMEGVLPPDVQWRKDKANLGSHLKVNLLKYGSRDLDDAIDSRSYKLRKYVDPQSLKDAYRDYKLDPHKKKSDEVMLILTMAYLLKWLEQNNFVGDSPPKVSRDTKAGSIRTAVRV